MFYLIQGVFFQSQQVFDIGFRSVEGAVPVLKEGIYSSMFCGAISPCRGDQSELSGSLVDQFGESILTKIELSPTRLEPTKFSFTKKYNHRSDLIQYSFETQVGNVWVGKWRGIAVGSGVAKCKLTEVTDLDFFDYISTLEALGMLKEVKS